MKKTFLTILFLTVALTVTNLNAQCPHSPKCVFDSCYYGGAGTEIEPYKILNKYHIDELRDSLTANTYIFPCSLTWHCNKHFRLMQDIGDTIRQTLANYHMWGHFYGGGHKLILALDYPDFMVGLPERGRSGLFNAVQGSVDNLIVDGYINNGNSTIAYTNGNSITNCVSNVNINSLHNYSFSGSERSEVGGIVHRNDGIITHCVNNGSVSTGGVTAGGIAAVVQMGLTVNCVNNGKITATGLYQHFRPWRNGVGGIVGTIYSTTSEGSTISNNINLGSIEGVYSVGGVMGSSGNQATDTRHITNNINYSFVKGVENVGGIIGRNIRTNVTVSNNSNFGVVEGTSNVGCIIGLNFNNGATLTNNHYDKQMCGEED